mmetsp:Transcript_46828/g.111411  ORF Transcript_46828/g.111411 Transcript_46828/m.111411 type:complete len:755 (-) Transcript_46828:75-2339(-)
MADRHTHSNNSSNSSDLKKKAAHWFSKVKNAVEDGSQKSSQLLDKVKSKVAPSGSSTGGSSSNRKPVRDGTAPPPKVVYSCGGVSGTRSGHEPPRNNNNNFQPPTRSAGSSSSSKQRPPPAAPAAEDEIQQLTALGFSVAASRHALSKCAGNVELAASWLADKANSDEMLAAELEAETVDPLAPGRLARISGLRSAKDLNGVPVVLEAWDNGAQRWAVRLPNGSHKSIRPKNLDPLKGKDEETAATLLFNEVKSRQVDESEECAKRLQEEELEAQALRKKVCQMIAPTDMAEAQEALMALSNDELLEVLARLHMPSEAAAVPAASSSSSQPAGGMDTCAAAADPADRPAKKVDDAPAQPPPADSEAEAKAATAEVPDIPSAEAAEEESKTIAEDEVAAASGEAAATAADQATSGSATAERAEQSSASAAAEQAIAKATAEAEERLRNMERELRESSERMQEWENERKRQASELEAREAELRERQAHWEAQVEESAKKAREAEQREATLRQQQEEEREQEAARLAEEKDAQRAKDENADSPPENEASAASDDISNRNLQHEQELQEQKAELQRLQEEAAEAVKELEQQKEAARRTAEERELQLLEEEAEQRRIADALRDEEARLRQQKKSVLMLQQSLLRRSISPKQEGGGCINMEMDDSACAVVEASQDNTMLGEQDDHDAEAADASDEEEVWDLDWSSIKAQKAVEIMSPTAPAEPFQADEGEEATSTEPPANDAQEIEPQPPSATNDEVVEQ